MLKFTFAKKLTPWKKGFSTREINNLIAKNKKQRERIKDIAQLDIRNKNSTELYRLEAEKWISTGDGSKTRLIKQDKYYTLVEFIVESGVKFKPHNHRNRKTKTELFFIADGACYVENEQGKHYLETGGIYIQDAEKDHSFTAQAETRGFAAFIPKLRDQ